MAMTHVRTHDLHLFRTWLQKVWGRRRARTLLVGDSVEKDAGAARAGLTA